MALTTLTAPFTTSRHGHGRQGRSQRRRSTKQRSIRLVSGIHSIFGELATLCKPALTFLSPMPSVICWHVEDLSFTVRLPISTLLPGPPQVFYPLLVAFILAARHMHILSFKAMECGFFAGPRFVPITVWVHGPFIGQATAEII